MAISDAFVQKVASRSGEAIFNALKIGREGRFLPVNSGRLARLETIFNALKIAGWSPSTGAVSRVKVRGSVRPLAALGHDYSRVNNPGEAAFRVSLTRETRPQSPVWPGGEGG